VAVGQKLLAWKDQGQRQQPWFRFFARFEGVNNQLDGSHMTQHQTVACCVCASPSSSLPKLQFFSCALGCCHQLLCGQFATTSTPSSVPELGPYTPCRGSSANGLRSCQSQPCQQLRHPPRQPLLRREDILDIHWRKRLSHQQRRWIHHVVRLSQQKVTGQQGTSGAPMPQHP